MLNNAVDNHNSPGNPSNTNPIWRGATARLRYHLPPKNEQSRRRRALHMGVVNSPVCKLNRCTPSRTAKSATRYQACGTTWSVSRGFMLQILKIVQDGVLGSITVKQMN